MRGKRNTRMRLFVGLATKAFFLFFSGTCWAASAVIVQSVDTESLVVGIDRSSQPFVLTRKDRRARSAGYLEWLKNRSGLELSTTALPAAVYLQIDWSDQKSTGSQSCSGALISPTQVLTAAHCVCGVFRKNAPWFASNFEDCQPILAQVRVHVFIPTGGIFEMEGMPLVQPIYLNSRTAAPANKPLADIAIIKLDGVVDVVPAKLGKITATSRIALASFGEFALAVAQDDDFVAGQSYKPGVQQMSIQQKATLEPEFCAEKEYATDTICTQFFAARQIKGPLMDAGLCGGDSGGPLFAVKSDGDAELVATASYFNSASQTCNTDLQSERMNFFVDLSRYADWISGNVDRTTAVEVGRSACTEHLVVGPDIYEIEGSPKLITISTMSLSGDEVGALKADGFEQQCRVFANGRHVACRLSDVLSPVVEIPSRLAQITVCE